MYSFSEPNDLRMGVVIFGTLVFFYCYYYFAHSSFLEKAVQKRTAGKSGELWLFLLRKLSGLVFLGLFPAFFYMVLLEGSFEKFGFSLNHFSANFFIISGLVFFIALFLFLRHTKSPAQNTLQMKKVQWGSSLFALNLLGWSLYLIAYEFLFRGVLLFECYESIGFWPAIAVNITIYSAIHMVNGKEQALGALIFGAIACYLTLTRGTVLIPVFMHIALSGFSDYYSIRLNPEIGFTKYNLIKSR